MVTVSPLVHAARDRDREQDLPVTRSVRIVDLPPRMTNIIRTVLILSAFTLAFTACDEHDAPLGETLVRDCGDPPVAPGWSVAFSPDGQTVTMPRADYEAIKSWRDAVDTWIDCGIGHP